MAKGYFGNISLRGSSAFYFQLHLQPLRRFSVSLFGHWQALSPEAKLPSMPLVGLALFKFNCEVALLHSSASLYDLHYDISEKLSFLCIAKFHCTLSYLI